MTSMGLALVLQMSVLVAGEKSYAEAHEQVLTSGKPMVVMVTADWCPACQVMKTSVLPQVRQRGLLRRVAFAVVNVDRERELGEKLAAGGPIPQLLMYRRTPDGWRLRRLVGGQSMAAVEQFINQGVELNDRNQSDEKTRHAESPQSASPTRVSQREASSAAIPGKG